MDSAIIYTEVLKNVIVAFSISPLVGGGITSILFVTAVEEILMVASEKKLKVDASVLTDDNVIKYVGL